MVVILYNIRSGHNVGSIFRTADALGVGKIYITGITPRPGQSGRAGKDIAKTALGAERTVVWEYIKRTGDCVKRLKKQGFRVVALEQNKRAVDIRTFKTPSALALVVGAEITGISKQILAQCDTIIEIPMFGKKESLNVSVAFGVAGYQLKFKSRYRKAGLRMRATAWRNIIPLCGKRSGHV